MKKLMQDMISLEIKLELKLKNMNGYMIIYHHSLTQDMNLNCNLIIENNIKH